MSDKRSKKKIIINAEIRLNDKTSKCDPVGTRLFPRTAGIMMAEPRRKRKIVKIRDECRGGFGSLPGQPNIFFVPRHPQSVIKLVIKYNLTVYL